MTDFFERMITAARNWDTQYGHIRMIKTESEHIYVEYYNGGWSENEELERDLTELGNIVVTKHPVILLHIKPKEYAILFGMKPEYWQFQIDKLESLCSIPTEIKEKYEINL